MSACFTVESCRFEERKRDDGKYTHHQVHPPPPRYTHPPTCTVEIDVRRFSSRVNPSHQSPNQTDAALLERRSCSCHCQRDAANDCSHLSIGLGLGGGGDRNPNQSRMATNLILERKKKTMSIQTRWLTRPKVKCFVLPRSLTPHAVSFPSISPGVKGQSHLLHHPPPPRYGGRGCVLKL